MNQSCLSLFSDFPANTLSEIKEKIRSVISAEKDIDTKISIINEIKKAIHDLSPFKGHPVDCVVWVPFSQIKANDYNPNKVAPPEMKLLEHSIREDGYTQPIVAWQKKESQYEVVDGFHRNRVGKESKDVRESLFGYLPVTILTGDKTEKKHRIASTIRHNRARGKHQIDAMSDIVLELKSRNWTNQRISKELGMDEDEILRLCQISGLASLFSNEEFSQSWEVEAFENEDFVELEGDLENDIDINRPEFRATNTDDPNRVFHTWDKWECYKAGFYNTTVTGKTKKECEESYKTFLSNISLFSSTLEKVISEWKYSCEHYLTNKAMNRIAWLGQASCCYHTGIPACFRSGFYLLSESQQKEANETTLKYLNIWLSENNMDTVSMEEAMGGSLDRQVDIY